MVSFHKSVDIVIDKIFQISHIFTHFNMLSRMNEFKYNCITLSLL